MGFNVKILGKQIVITNLKFFDEKLDIIGWNSNYYQSVEVALAKRIVVPTLPKYLKVLFL